MTNCSQSSFFHTKHGTHWFTGSISSGRKVEGKRIFWQTCGSRINREQKKVSIDHRLRGSASPVLTATGFVNGKGQFSTPYRIDTPQPITKIFVTGDYIGDPYGYAKLGAYPSTGGFWAHGWNITKIFLVMPLLGTHVARFSRMIAHTTQGCNFFGNFSHCSPFRGSKTPQKNNFRAWIGVFKPNSPNRKTCIFSKLLHQFHTNFCTVIKTTKCPSWVIPTHALQIQDDGRPISWKNKKSLKIVMSWRLFERFWRNLACSWSSTLLTVPTVKNLKFRKSKMAAAAILKNHKIATSQPRFERFWRNFAQNLAWWCSSTFLTVPTA